MQNEPKRPTESWEALMPWLKRFAETFQKSAPLSQPQVESYRIALCDLSSAQLENACAKALREWTFSVMPPPGFIRECSKTDQAQYLGPSREEYPEIAPDEREEALEYSTALKAYLRKNDPYSPPPSVQFKSVDSAELDEMLRKYREWLVTAAERDEVDRKSGLSPLPRHEAERLAIFLALPIETRRQIARSGEWTKLATANM